MDSQWHTQASKPLTKALRALVKALSNRSARNSSLSEPKANSEERQWGFFFWGGGGYEGAQNEFTFKNYQVLKKLPTDVLVKYKVTIGPVSNEKSYTKRSRVFPKGFRWI